MPIAYAALAIFVVMAALFLFARRKVQQVEDALAKIALLKADKDIDRKKYEVETLEREEKDLEAKRLDSAAKFRAAVDAQHASDWRPGSGTGPQSH